VWAAEGDFEAPRHVAGPEHPGVTEVDEDRAGLEGALEVARLEAPRNGHSAAPPPDPPTALTRRGEARRGAMRLIGASASRGARAGGSRPGNRPAGARLPPPRPPPAPRR